MGARRVTKKADKQPSLEDSLAEITQLIDQMEQGELTLEQSLTHFERGITLIKHCQKVLTDAEQKVDILIQSNKGEELTAYGEEERDESDDDENAN
jgi:exodeoxyribonuclease VII small subunit